MQRLDRGLVGLRRRLHGAAPPPVAGAYLLVAATLLAAYRFLPQTAQGAVYAWIGLSAPVAVLVGAQRNGDARQRGAWRLVAAGLAVFATSDLVFNLQHLNGSGSASPAVAVYALGYPLLLAGLLLLVRLGYGGWERSLLVEVAILAVALTLVQWVLIAAHGSSFGAGPTVDFATAIAYGVADGLLLAAAEHIVLASIRRTLASLAIFGGALALLAADLWYAFEPKAYAFGDAPDLGWLLSYALFAAAALTPSVGKLAGGAARPFGMPVGRLVSLGVALAALPALVVISATADVGTGMDAVLGAGGLLIVALVLIRIASLVNSVVRAQHDELEARQRMEAARNEFATLIENLQAGVLLEDVEGRVVITNDAFCRIFGCARDPAELAGAETPHASGRAADVVLHPETFIERTEQLTRSRQLVRGERVDLLDGRSFLRDHIPVFRGGSYEGSLWHYLDVTDQRRVQLELAKARDQAVETTRLKSEFLAVMSHEIRTPMYGVIGAADLLDKTRLDTEQRELTNVLRDSAEALLSLLNDILDFSKIEADKLSLVDEELELVGLVDATLDSFASEARGRGLWLSSYVAAELPTHVRGDVLRLRQILVNLVGNAIKFTPTGEIAVRVEPAATDGSGVRIRLTVADTGIGIARDAQARLFEPFTQFDSSRSRTQPGTGLGLAICTRIAELMDGSLACESEPGTGTAMSATVRLGRIPSAGTARARDSLAGLRALVVGTEPLTRANLVSVLADAGMAAEGFATPGEAGAALADADVVLSDVDVEAPATVTLAKTNAARREGNAHTIVLPAARGRILSLVERAVHGVTAQPASAETPRAGPAPLGIGAVLVVEDNEINRKLTMRQLARLGVAARSVASGREALAALDGASYRAVLMDCRMPGMDGFATTRAIRAREAGTDAHIPIVAITADAQQQDRQLCLDAGMDDYLTKPLTLDELATCLVRWGEEVGPIAPAAADVDPLVAEIGEEAALELIELWLDRLDDQLDTLTRAVEEGDSETAFAITHGLKSTSAVLGAETTARLAAELEAEARAGRVAGAGAILARLAHEARRVEEDLAARLARTRG